MTTMKKETMALALVSALTLSARAGETLDYAKAEAARLLGRAGVTAEISATESPATLTIVPKGASRPKAPSTAAVRDDGYATAASNGGFAIAARGEKGVLNGVYALAEKLGFAFVMPGEEGERVPAALTPVGDGEWTENPRFPYRGIFYSSDNIRYSAREMYAFFAKLRFNAMTAHVSASAVVEDAFAKTLGLRLEVGGHGMSDCLPRKLFETEPELFRMFQPEDFGGKRMKDSNFCATNPKTAEIVKENFKKKIAPSVARGYHAVHGWADDLPGGGWCMCSRCRALTGADQSQLAMNIEAQAIRELGVDMRVPAIAYHDTMFPSEIVKPDALCYFLFAPRERCYAHALDDASCALNRRYLRSLAAWAERYRAIGDSHTFEYYNDKILYRGHMPYLPDVILGDANAYEQAGIESWMSLQVGGNPVAPDWNMLAHACVAWEKGLTGAALTRRLAEAAGGTEADAWATYLGGLAAAYETGWQVCNVPSAVYFDYRFMPERPSDVGGAELVANLVEGQRRLADARDALAAVGPKMAPFARRIAEQEVAYAAFAAADFQAMVAHQRGLVAIADSWNGAGKEVLKRGLDDLREAVAQLKRARDLYAASAKGFEKNQYYFGFVDKWTVPEIENKIRVYSQALAEK